MGEVHPQSLEFYPFTNTMMYSKFGGLIILVVEATKGATDILITLLRELIFFSKEKLINKIKARF